MSNNIFSTFFWFRPSIRAALNNKKKKNHDNTVPRGHVRPTRRPIRQTLLPETDERSGASQSTAAHPHAFHAYEPFDPLSTPIHASGPVDIPPDPSGVLGDSHAAREILGHESLVIVRQLEMLNVFMGVSRGLFFFFPKMTFCLFNSILFFSV